jgi:hypothetical protein
MMFYPSGMTLSTQTKLRLIGAGLMLLLLLSAWNLAQDLTPFSLIPMVCVAYAGFTIVGELTWNRDKVPTLATSWIGRRRMAEALRKASNGKAGYKITDLGSGRGELSRALAKSLPHAHVTGIEIAKIPYRQSLLLQRLLGPNNISYKLADFETHHCRDDDAVVMFLSGNLTAIVGEKLQRELKPGTTILSHTFPLRGAWEPVEVITFRTPIFKDKIFVYRK